jgi:hypothetical protein
MRKGFFNRATSSVTDYHLWMLTRPPVDSVKTKMGDGSYCSTCGHTVRQSFTDTGKVGDSTWVPVDLQRIGNDSTSYFFVGVTYLDQESPNNIFIAIRNLSGVLTQCEPQYFLIKQFLFSEESRFKHDKAWSRRLTSRICRSFAVEGICLLYIYIYIYRFLF